LWEYSYTSTKLAISKSNMTGVTSGAGTAYTARAPELTPGF
jgi:hypothetical protein